MVENIHGLTLDEPLAVITDQTTRIVNYNWRGLGESSVFPTGQGADASLGNPLAEIDWPAATQAETYFTPGPSGSASGGNPKKWMGTFVANGVGTTGMLYRRNRYFNPSSGQFTQADPIGIAGGMNAFGFANGDPVNFSDPFGLCPWCIGGALGAVVGGGGTLLYNYANNKPLTDHLFRNTLVGAGIGATLGLGWQAVAAGAARTAATAEATATATAATSKVPFEDFPAWGRTVVGWGQDAAGAARAMADLTAEKAAALDPAKVQAAKAFYESAVAAGKGGAAARARVELMQKVIELQK